MRSVCQVSSQATSGHVRASSCVLTTFLRMKGDETPELTSWLVAWREKLGLETEILPKNPSSHPARVSVVLTPS